MIRKRTFRCRIVVGCTLGQATTHHGPRPRPDASQCLFRMYNRTSVHPFGCTIDSRRSSRMYNLDVRSAAAGRRGCTISRKIRWMYGWMYDLAAEGRYGCTIWMYAGGRRPPRMYGRMYASNLRINTGVRLRAIALCPLTYIGII